MRSSTGLWRARIPLSKVWIQWLQRATSGTQEKHLRRKKNSLKELPLVLLLVATISPEVICSFGGGRIMVWGANRLWTWRDFNSNPGSVFPYWFENEINDLYPIWNHNSPWKMGILIPIYRLFWGGDQSLIYSIIYKLGLKSAC